MLCFDLVASDRVRLAHWRAVTARHLVALVYVALVRAGARFERGILVEREAWVTGTEEAAQKILIRRSLILLRRVQPG